MDLVAIRERWRFPDKVNANAARLVGGAVALLAIGVIVFHAYALVPWLAVGFLLRVLSGPKLSPLALLMIRVVMPVLKIPDRPVPGPPKRFAQGVGLGFTAVASVLALVAHVPLAADGVLGMLVFAASLEAIFDYCLGCKVYAFLIIRGWLPPPGRPTEITGPTP